MGLLQDNHTSKIYLNIVNGKLAKRVTEGTIGATEREIEYKNEKRMVWEILYSSVEAKIDGIEIKEDGLFGDQILIDLVDGIEHFTVTLTLNSREAKSFMMCLPNIDLSKPITLNPYNYERKADHKKMIGIGVLQGDIDTATGRKPQVAWAYTKEKGLPTAPEGEQLDKDEFKLLMAQLTIFLKKATKKYIATMKVGAPALATDNSRQQIATEEKFTASSQDDDLPF